MSNQRPNRHVFSGMYVSLRLDVPGETLPILIERAAVRWNRGREVGVGFITVVPLTRNDSTNSSND
jgi:hypothetical protein